jgi:hypothetical protein
MEWAPENAAMQTPSTRLGHVCIYCDDIHGRAKDDDELQPIPTNAWCLSNFAGKKSFLMSRNP